MYERDRSEVQGVYSHWLSLFVSSSLGHHDNLYPQEDLSVPLSPPSRRLSHFRSYHLINGIIGLPMEFNHWLIRSPGGLSLALYNRAAAHRPLLLCNRHDSALRDDMLHPIRSERFFIYPIYGIRNLRYGGYTRRHWIHAPWVTFCHSTPRHCSFTSTQMNESRASHTVTRCQDTIQLRRRK